MMYIQLEDVKDPNTVAFIINTYCLFMITIPLEYLRSISQGIQGIVSQVIETLIPSAPPLDEDVLERNNNEGGNTNTSSGGQLPSAPIAEPVSYANVVGEEYIQGGEGVELPEGLLDTGNGGNYNEL